MPIFDIEADGLMDATKIHVLSYSNSEGGITSTFDYQEMRDFFLSAKELIGHRIMLYDVPVVERILGIKIKARLIDTLALSWYLNHKRRIHGLDSYGAEFGIPKPKITDWVGLTPEEYRHRCEEDVRINTALYDQLTTKMSRIYFGNPAGAEKMTKYLMFKMDCLRQQEADKWKFDEAYCNEGVNKIKPLLDSKIEELKLHMPKVEKFAVRAKPAKPFKKDGSLSVAGENWLALLKAKGLPMDYVGEIKVQVGEEEPKPSSSDQVKSWLFSLGWVPATFKYVRNEDGSQRTIPQIRVDGKGGKELCSSVLLLVDKHPGVAVLDGVTVLSHRLSVLNGFLKSQKGGYLIAQSQGLTNTLRFKHTEIVNLPGVDKAWGQEIRGCLVAPEGCELCGSDMDSLEDNTKRHYMHKFDPEYVAEMSVDGFDAHLDLAKFAGAVTAQEILDFVCKKVGSKNLTPIRKNFKAANYSCIYGVGAATLSRTLGISVKAAEELIKAYWERNHAVLKVIDEVEVKTVDGDMWLFNPVSELWYSLRYKKDIFSTLNQGTGVYCFDLWVREFRKVRPQLTGQFHDEVILCIKKGSRDKCRNLLNGAIDKVNSMLKLNVTLSVDIQFGDCYADIH